MTISDKSLKTFIACGKDVLRPICDELLAYREAARQASSWDDAPTWAVSRRPIPQRVKWVYYDAISTEEIKRDKIFLDTLEDRP